MRVSKPPLFGEKMSGAKRVWFFLMKCAASYFVFMIWRSVSCKNHTELPPLFLTFSLDIYFQ